MRRLLHITLISGLITALTGCVIGPTPHPVAAESAGASPPAQDLASEDPSGGINGGQDNEDGALPSGPGFADAMGGGEADLGDTEADSGEPDDVGPLDDSGPLDDGGLSD